jgi:hypothetical protein
MIATVILRRELTLNKAYRSTFGCFLGPIGWLLADALAPPTITIQIQTQTRTSKPPPQQQRTGRGRNFKVPLQGKTRFVGNEFCLNSDLVQPHKCVMRLSPRFNWQSWRRRPSR